jgi:hypothetical protein
MQHRVQPDPGQRLSLYFSGKKIEQRFVNLYG